ncbi:MAG: MoaD family protein [Bacillota bacterium]|nr:MoaD family protein [Bacillota bacterium]
MEVRVKYFAVFRDASGRDGDILRLPDGTMVWDLLELLVGQYAEGFRAFLGDPAAGKLKAGVLVLVNGRNVTTHGGLSRRLQHGDIVLLLPAIKGGVGW